MITSDKPLRDRRAEFPQWRDSDYDASFESNLVLHAMRELSGMGYPGSDKMNRQMAYDIMDLVIRFSQQGHSGMSASYSLQTLQRLLNFENLNPLTTDPADWIGVGDMIWQNRRRGEAFERRRQDLLPPQRGEEVGEEGGSALGRDAAHQPGVEPDEVPAPALDSSLTSGTQ